ncbi:MAG: hypothetical protein MASP_00528 [Candidatus Methanolliviera sp. GoM_asphalt]|nr:MAG: hypothetical protein MASP_00528 [Candidatus Methanolliviera sp. GoM_asphalt]
MKFNPFRAKLRGKPERYESDRKKKREADEMMRQARPMMKLIKYFKYFVPIMVLMFLMMILMFVPGSPIMGIMTRSMMKNVNIADMLGDESGSLGSSLFDDPKLMKKMTENIRMNPDFMQNMIKDNPEMLESMIDERMIQNMMNADTIDGMISAMPPEMMNKMMSEMMSNSPEMMSDMMSNMLRDNPDVMSSMFSSMDEETMNVMFSTIFQDYDMVMTGGTMSMNLPEATANLIGSKKVNIEITEPMGISGMNFKVEKKAKT